MTANRCVPSLVRKVPVVSADRTVYEGSLFQMTGAADEKRLASITVGEPGVLSSPGVVERKVRGGM